MSNMKKTKGGRMMTNTGKGKLLEGIGLTANALKKVLRYFKYEEMLALRLVCRSFNQVISGMFNNTFKNLDNEIEDALNEASKYLNRSYLEHNTIRHFKILYYLRSEYNIINMTIGKYLDESVITFTGGSILESFLKILKTSRKQMEYSNEYMKIFHLVEVFLNNFDMGIDKVLSLRGIDSALKFGVKLIDILDCGLEFGRNIELSRGADCIYLEGEYHGNDGNHFLDLPDMNKKKMSSDKEMKTFVQLMRNNVRWSNLLFCIQKETTDLALDYFTPVQKIDTDTSFIFRKDTGKVFRQKEKSVTYNLSLKCWSDELPRKLASFAIRDALGQNQQQTGTESPYEFNMLIKTKTRTEDGSLNEKVIKLYNIGNECISSEFNKVIAPTK